jgi:hypothetical protein
VVLLETLRAVIPSFIILLGDGDDGVRSAATFLLEMLAKHGKSQPCTSGRR